MSKELPYFKFFSGEWLNGDITLEDYELQGIFINLCAYYWHKDGEVTIEQAEKKLRTDKIINFFDIGLLKEDDNRKLVISFLDEQLGEFTTRKKRLSEAGKKGAKRKKELATLKPPLNHPLATREDKEKIKSKNKSIEDRKTVFKENLAKFINDYDKNLLNDFYSYWSEHGDTDKKMRYEKQTSFSISRRLTTWKNNSKKFNSNGGLTKTTSNNRARTTTAERQDFE